MNNDLKNITMPDKLLSQDGTVVITMITALFANLWNIFTEMPLNQWFAILISILAILAGVIKLRIYLIDLKIKRLTLREMKREHKEHNHDN